MSKKKSDMESIESDKVLLVTFLGEEVGYYYWNGDRVSLSINTENENISNMLEEVKNKNSFFNPRTDSYEHTDARHNFELFLIKAIPELFMYSFSYEIIDLKFSSKIVYMFITEFTDGAIVEDLAFNCSYNEKDKIISFWNGDRERVLKVEKILKDNDEFEFTDGNGFKVLIYPVTIDDFRRCRKSIFINAPGLVNDEEVQKWLLEGV